MIRALYQAWLKAKAASLRAEGEIAEQMAHVYTVKAVMLSEKADEIERRIRRNQLQNGKLS